MQAPRTGSVAEAWRISHPPPMDAGKFFVVTLAIGAGLSVLFWSELWLGGGLVGGDLYSYFFPQKVFYAEQLAEGRIPLWNDRVGFGYPVLGESQTGALYPPNLLFYSLLDVNDAYNASQILHYILAFAAAVWFLRTLDVSRLAAVFGGLVYAYSWFPPRICLEWAILGGPYLPLGLGLIERFVQTGRRGYLMALTLGLAGHLLAGHYNIAFIECVAWSVYGVCRSLWPGRERAVTAASKEQTEVSQISDPAAKSRIPLILASLVAGFALVSFQLLETYALKQQSQRVNPDRWQTPAYGHMPPVYLSQVFASWWYWYSPYLDTEKALSDLPATVDAATNAIEAHLYFGLVPLTLAVLWMVIAAKRKRRGAELIFAGLGLFAVVYSTGALLPLTQNLPGFSYFSGPARWGVLATLAVSLFAARGFDWVIDRVKPALKLVAAGVAFTLATVDLAYVSQLVTYAQIVAAPAIDYLEESPMREVFQQLPRDTGLPRVYGPGPNVLTLFGVAQWPTYLGLGPDVYWTAMPQQPAESSDPIFSEEQRAWLADNAVQYVLTFEPIDHVRWRLRPILSVADPILNTIWARGPDEPVYFYQIPDARPSIGFADPSDGTIEVTVDEADRVAFNAVASAAMESGAVEVRRFVNTDWSEVPSYERWDRPNPLLMVDRTVSAEQAGESVGGYHLAYRPAWKRGSMNLACPAVTIFGFAYLGWLWLTRRKEIA